MRRARIDPDEFPFGLLLDMGASGWNLALMSIEFDSLVHAFGSRDVHITMDPRRLAPLLFRREM
jgi:hypothetical protein